VSTTKNTKTRNDVCLAWALSCRKWDAWKQKGLKKRKRPEHQPRSGRATGGACLVSAYYKSKCVNAQSRNAQSRTCARLVKNSAKKYSGSPFVAHYQIIALTFAKTILHLLCFCKSLVDLNCAMWSIARLRLIDAPWTPQKRNLPFRSKFFSAVGRSPMGMSAVGKSAVDTIPALLTYILIDEWRHSDNGPSNFRGSVLGCIGPHHVTIMYYFCS